MGLEPVSKSEYAALVAKVWSAVQETGREGGYGGVSFFEMMTAMALVHFRDIRADFQVLEVGLGGRLDATNIVTPEVSVITSISMDHVATLGDTIAKIATEKAGIIKPGVPCVIAPQRNADAVDVFRQTARERGAPMILVQDTFKWEKTARDLNGQSFTLRRRDGGTAYRLRTPLLGDYQLENAAAAVAAIETLAEAGYDIPKAAIEAGVRKVRWSGRFQVFERDGKTIVVDGAHNPYSMAPPSGKPARVRAPPRRAGRFWYSARSADTARAGCWTRWRFSTRWRLPSRRATRARRAPRRPPPS